MRRIALLLLVIGPVPAARADGGTVRFSERHGPCQLTVFTTPTPLRAGPMDVSVFVQDSTTGDRVEDVEVMMTVAPVGRPEQRTTREATAAAATNKLFRSASFELPHAGNWEVSVIVRGKGGSAEARFHVEAADALPSWYGLAAWIGWPLLAVGLFAVHQFLVRRRSDRQG